MHQHVYSTMHAVVPPCQQQCSCVYINLTASAVFVHHDAVHPVLQPLYDGVLKVLKRTTKYFLLLINCQENSLCSQSKTNPLLTLKSSPSVPHQGSTTCRVRFAQTPYTLYHSAFSHGSVAPSVMAAMYMQITSYSS